MGNLASTDLKAFLLKLHKNLQILQEREAKHAGSVPLNQITDHKKAITLTEQTLAGDLSETEWRKALKPLLVSLKEAQIIIDQQSQQIGGVNLSDIEGKVSIEGDIDASVKAGGDVVGGDKIINIYNYPAPPGSTVTEVDTPIADEPIKDRLPLAKQSKRKPRIFLCHASEDKPQVAKLYRKLKEAGYHPWLDKYDLIPGQGWRREIEKLIGDPYNLIVVCISNHSTTKRGVVQQEIRWALDVMNQMPEDAIYLIPARLEPCQAPDRLSRLHWVDLFEPDGFEHLKRALDYEINRRQPEPTLSKPKPAAKQPPITSPPQPKQTTPDPIVAPRQPFEPELIHIPAGEFLMGSDPKKDKDARGSEQLQHTLYLSDYYIAKTPVTKAQYAAWKNQTPPKGQENHPVVEVSWDDAVAYCQWLAKTTGQPYRLPSEAEWEKAARGTDGRIYPWGNQWDAKRCNIYEGGKKGRTTPVGFYPKGASPYGCLDMAGNVWEWVSSQYKAYPYDPADGREDLEAVALRVWRGGSWWDNQNGARCAFRSRNFSHDRGPNWGFRIVVSTISLPSDRAPVMASIAKAKYTAYNT